MAFVLGLDLGSGSIGWAVINYSNNRSDLRIIDLGCRIIPIDGSTLSKFDTGQSITVNADRTSKRTMRKMLDRYQARRNALESFLKSHDMMPDLSHDVSKETLWSLRAEAVSRKLSLKEIGRVLLLLCRKRGYNASKADLSSTDKQTQGYVADVKNRYQQLKESGMTIGQYYYAKLLESPEYRIKNQVLPRQAYIEEFDAIINNQSKYYPEIFTADNIEYLRNYLLFYQRPLKSCKHLVSKCAFEAKTITRDGKEIEIGPKVAHRTNPLFQLSRIYQVVNNIQLTRNHDPNEIYKLSAQKRRMIVNHLMTNEKLKKADLYAILFNDKKQRQWLAPDNFGNGIPGNTTLLAISKALNGKYPQLLSMDIDIIDRCDTTTGEVTKVVSPDVIKQPLYKLWHTLYSISNPDDLRATLRRNFDIDDETIERLVAIDFSKEAYGNMSEKALKKILPYLIEGDIYSIACEKAGYNHSDSITSEENQNRVLDTVIAPIKKGELRQPIVEKILNQLVNLVNALSAKYGEFSEIHIEMARELKQSREERNKKTKENRENEKRNSEIAKRIAEEYNLTPTKTRITKMKLWEETEHKCMYCGQTVPIKDFLGGYEVEVEHIVPKSLLFDDSFTNKVCACRECNRVKNNMTAYDFMRLRGDNAAADYVVRVRKMAADGKISIGKCNRLLMSKEAIPDDFIDRQLRESQYIARAAKDMLKAICRNVIATSGSVTNYLRHIWGWDKVLHDINLPRYEKAGLVKASETDGSLEIAGWDKRCDHRHHAIDALTIACSPRSIIQRLNNMSSLGDTRYVPFGDEDDEHKHRKSLLEQYAHSLPHFSYREVLEAALGLLVSLNQNLKSVTSGKRYVYKGGKRKCVQRDIIVPRGPLFEETVYGRIKRYDSKGNLYYEYVVKYPLSSIKSEKDAAFIVDKHIRELVVGRLKSVKDAKKAFDEPLYSDPAKTKQIKTVRCFTGIKSPLVAKRDVNGNPIGFAKAGANHHVAIYTDAQGGLHEHIVTFKQCVDRYTHHIPMIISNPKEVWDDVLNRDTELPQEFLSQLPKDGWSLMMSMRRNELFIIGLSKDEIKTAIKINDYALINSYLYKVQKLSSEDYCFMLNTQTKNTPSEFNKPDKRFIRIRNLKSLLEYNPIKVKVDILGNITLADD